MMGQRNRRGSSYTMVDGRKGVRREGWKECEHAVQKHRIYPAESAHLSLPEKYERAFNLDDEEQLRVVTTQTW